MVQQICAFEKDYHKSSCTALYIVILDEKINYCNQIDRYTLNLA
jgi:hypothetical protein